MMATTFFLPPIVPSPFGKAFARKFHSRSGSKEDTSSRSNNYHHTYPNDSPQTKRTIAVPASSFSPEKPTETKENIRHLPYNKNHLASPSRQACPARTADHSRRSVHSSVGPSHKPSEYTETFPTFEDIRTSTECGSEDTQYYTCVARSTDQSWSWPPDETTKPADVVDDGSNAPDQDCWSPPKHRKATAPPATTTQSDKPLGKAAGNFRRWASTFRHKRGQHRHEVSPRLAMTEVQTDTESALPAVLPRPRWHGKRSSNASSRFVTTIKTASLSNDSMSVLRQSHRYSRVSETRVNRGSDPRSSLDSQKPPSISTDDAALRRSIKRRHILQEILSSEESYVADLKTLHNLFSTLLASMSTISTQTRNSIQRNVTELLHIHEQIVNELHRVALRTTVREWNHVVSPLRHNMKRHRKWQSLDATSFHTPPRHAHPSVSLDVLKMRFLGSSSYVADPAEAADVARIFKNHMARFYVYEEYCAKYEIMVQELVHSHKVAPHWTSYEAGMEALANSIAPLSQRSSDGKKGLRASDLLIKPIQRICKYPLFFGDLQKHTPVVDCPSSHAEVDGVLNKVREMVGEINVATEDPRARERVQRRWLLQDRLKLCHDTSKATQFRMLGPVLLCGVLHVAYQTSTNVEGGYMMCVMFNSHLIVAAPAAEHGKFDVVATICLSDAKAVSTEDGRGMLPVPHLLF